ncbi:MAG TPA: hypothetical protein VHB02_01465 [Acidimicrobiales bacterium]|nr:hypothetical protein [Acidimicrobiales bacterium]
MAGTATMRPAGDVAARGPGPDAHRTGSGRRPWGGWREVGVVAFFVAVGVFACWQAVGTGHLSTAVTCSCGDPAQELWWLEWFPWAVAHGHDLFHTDLMYAGAGGVSALANTSYLLPAAVLSPVTVAAGPIASFNVAMVLSVALSSWAMYRFLSRLAGSLAATVLPATLYGLSPFMVANLPLGHLNLTMAWYPPVVASVAYDTVLGRRRSPVRLGVVLAAATVAQFFTGTELLAMTGIGAVVGVALGLLLAPRRIWPARHRALRVGGLAAAIAVPVLAYPLWYTLFGPRHVTGVIWPKASAGDLVSSLVDQGPLVHHSYPELAQIGYRGAVGLPVGYIGWPVLVFLLASVWLWWRSRLIWVACGVGLCFWWLSLGSRHGPLYPWNGLRHVPVLQQIQPQRFSQFVVLVVCLLMAVALDRWRSWLVARWRSSAGAPSGAVVAAVGIGLVLSIAGWYTLPFTEASTPPPQALTADRGRFDPATRLLLIPYPSSEVSSGMGWQAELDMPFAIAGGYVVVPGRNGHDDAWVSKPGGALPVLDTLSYGYGRSVVPSAAQLRAVRQLLQRTGVTRVIVTTQGRNPIFAATLMTAVIGRPPTFHDGAWEWDLASTPMGPMAPRSTLRRCAAQVRLTDLQAGLRCINSAVGRSAVRGSAVGR